MEKHRFADTSTDELKKKQKALAAITGIFMGMLLVLVAVNIYSITKKGFTASVIIPLTLMPIALINFKNLKDIKAEIKSRELSEI